MKDMKFRGIIRKADNLCRLVIPSEYRKELGIKTDDELEIFLIKEGIFIRKVERENVKDKI